MQEGTRVPGSSDSPAARSGWRAIGPIDLGKRTVKAFVADDMATHAAALAYSALFSLFPFLIFLIALLGFLHIPGFFTWLLDEGKRILPASAHALLQGTVEQVQGRASGGLLSIGAIVAMWGASSGIRAVMNALNVAYGVRETRPLWKKYLLSVAYTFGFAGLLACIAALMLIGPRPMNWLAREIGLGSVFVTVWNIARWPVLVAMMMIVVALIYEVVPDVKHPFRLITPGSVVAVVLWLAASAGLSSYVSRFANYNATYGSLGGVVVLLLYLYISSAVLLLGAEMNGVLRSESGGSRTED